MQTRYDSSGRVQPTEGRYLIQPGECLLCKRIPKNSDEIFANLGVELDYYGQCYLCTDCCGELANFVLYVSPTTHQSLSDEYLAIRVQNLGLKKQVDYLKGLLDARIDFAGSSEPDSDGSSSIPLFEVNGAADEVNRILDEYESESLKSGKG